ncbi:MAG: hypothetical protein NT029_06090 [Armatimonadetes bacterium]|nr:hypothetical protein [Armatimonadota bacterium]
MACRWTASELGKAPLWHRLACAECRKSAAADARVRLAVECMKAQPLPVERMEAMLRSLALDAQSARTVAERASVSYKRVRQAALGLAALLVVAVAGRVHYSLEDPGIAVPAVHLPSPNAYYTFDAAAQRLAGDNEIEIALKQMDPKKVPAADEKRYAAADRAALVAANAPALDLLHTGFHQPYLAKPGRSFTATFPELARFRSLARLCALASASATEQGRWGEAMERSLDAVEMGRMLPKGASMIGYLVGLACESIGRAQAWKCVEHLTDAEACAELARLERLRTRFVPYREVLTEEKWGTVAGLQELMRSREWADSSRQFFGSDSQVPPGAALLIFMRYPKREIVRNLMRAYDEEIGAAGAGYMPSVQSYSPWEEDANRLGLDPISRMLMPTFSQAAFKDTLNRADDALLRAALALRVHRLRHGEYPAGLFTLAEDGCADVQDPFVSYSSNRDLRYRKAGKGYLLYSVGPNSTDNQGQPITNQSSGSSPASTAAQQDSFGDLVAPTSVAMAPQP